MRIEQLIKQVKREDRKTISAYLPEATINTMNALSERHDISRNVLIQAAITLFEEQSDAEQG